MKRIMMNTLAVTLFGITSLTASANTVIKCNLKAMSVTISQDGESNTFNAKIKKGSETQLIKDVPEIRFTRSAVEKDEGLVDLLTTAGLKIENILAARAYITDSNNEGKAGLMVFTAGRGEIVGQVFFASYAGYAEACKR